MILHIAKELCDYCLKAISIGQAITECVKCNTIIHTKCYSKGKFRVINEKYFCDKCAKNEHFVYNPFPSFNTVADDPKFYNEEMSDSIDLIHTMSALLKNCKSFTDMPELSNFINADHEIANSAISSIFLNIDGNLSNFDNFLSHINLDSNYNFPIIGLAETNTDACIKHTYNIKGYNSFYQDTFPGKKKGTGVALYIHMSLSTTVNTHMSNLSINLESIFVTIDIEPYPLTFGVVYRPPGGELTEFLNEFNMILNQAPRNTFIMGDFNIDLHKIEDKYAKQYEESILTSGFSPLISLYTHEKPNCRKTCIDNIFCNNPETVSYTGTIENSISHHKPIFQISNLQCTKNDKQDSNIKQYYDFSNKNTDKFVLNLKDSLNRINLSTITFTEFHDVFKENLDNTCKLQTPRCSKRNNMVNPWVTDSIIESIKIKRNLYQKWKKSKSSNKRNGDAKLQNDFIVHRRKLKNIIRSTKSKYYYNKINAHKNDMKKTWAVINELRGKQKSSIKPSFIIDNQRIYDRRIIAHEFNKYFNSIATNMNKDFYESDGIPISNVPSFSEYLTRPTINSIYMHDCTIDEIQKIISELENGKSSDIPIGVIKKSSAVISIVLVEIFNNAMKNGEFPEELKIGRISPIYKKDNEELLENYRPISTIPIFAKIFEKIIYSRFYSFFTSQNILNEDQFGFREKHSTSHALNVSVDYIDRAIKNGNHVLGIFIDLSKAFDTIDHNILLAKLHHYGIRGNANKLMVSYLTKRQQYTKVLGEESDKLTVIYGVPQGSVLGPLLFLLYINDIVYSSTLARFILFADDTNIFVLDKCPTEVYKKANIILQSVENYMKGNKLHINVKKCSYMHFKPKGKFTESENACIKLSGVVITQVKQVKFLGVIIDDQLTWKPHIDYLASKLKSCIGVLNRIKDYIPTSQHKILYHTLFESHLSYGITVWGGASQKQIDSLFILQKRCIRIMFGDKDKYLEKFKTCARSRPHLNQKLGSAFYTREHTKPIFSSNSILTAQNLYCYYSLVEIFKVLKFRNPISLFSCFKLSSRKDTLLITPQPTRNFVYQASILWNRIRPNLSNIRDFSPKLCAIKTKIKEIILKTQKLGDETEWAQENSFF